MIDLNTKYLYFGSPEENVTEISSGKFLTTFIPIACCFAIPVEDLYGPLNKRYCSINWGYDIWSKDEKYLSKQQIPHHINITNNAQNWVKTSGQSIGYVYTIELTDYIKQHIQTFNDSDPKWEVVYSGHKHIPIKDCKKVSIDWTCCYSPIKLRKCGPALVTPNKYEKPYSIDILKDKYPKLLNDPCHKWRAKNGIELIHEEPSFEEQKRIFCNFWLMSKPKRDKSDRKSKELFGLDNTEHHNVIMERKWHDQNYFELNDHRNRYDLRDMVENGLQYIHISLSNKSIDMEPRVPKNIMTFISQFKMFDENNSIPRICCSDSIFGALSAIRIDDSKTYYVHLLQPKHVLTNREVSQYVPDAVATGECWILDKHIKTTVVGKLQINGLLPYVFTFLKNKKGFICAYYYDYDFIPFESKVDRKYRKILNSIQ